jgi:hypothetical protein
MGPGSSFAGLAVKLMNNPLGDALGNEAGGVSGPTGAERSNILGSISLGDSWDSLRVIPGMDIQN